jgi:hypothetical protein
VLIRQVTLAPVLFQSVFQPIDRREKTLAGQASARVPASAADYLLTWNCRPLATAQILTRLEQEARHLGWQLPKVCTPAELMGDSSDET